MAELNKKKGGWLNGFVIVTFVILYALTSSISMIHIVDFFNLSNSYTMSWVISVAFEVGAAASLAALTILDRLKKELVLGIFVLLTLLQVMGNVYYSFTNLTLVEIKDWVDLFGLTYMDQIMQRRIIAIVSGLPLPIIALGFIKSLTDYLKPKGHHTVFDESPAEKSELTEKAEALVEEIEEHKKDNPELKEEYEEDLPKTEAEEAVEKSIDAVSDGVKEEEIESEKPETVVITKDDILKSISRDDLIAIMNEEDVEDELITEPAEAKVKEELIVDESPEPLQKINQSLNQEVEVEEVPQIEFDESKSIDIMGQLEEMKQEELKKNSKSQQITLEVEGPADLGADIKVEIEEDPVDELGYEDEDYIEDETELIAKAPDQIPLEKNEPKVEALDSDVYSDLTKEEMTTRTVSLSELSKERAKLKEFEEEKKKRFLDDKGNTRTTEQTPRVTS